MQITSVTYQKTYSIGPYLTERIGVEASIDEGQDPKIVLSELKKLCDEVNEANNPHLAQPIAQPPEPEKLPEIQVEKPIAGKPFNVINEIASTTSPTVLKIYKGMLKTESDKLAYENKMNELLNQPITNDK